MMYFEGGGKFGVAGEARRSGLHFFLLYCFFIPFFYIPLHHF